MERRINEIWANMASIIEERSAQDMAQTIPSFKFYADTLLKDLRTAMLLCNEQALELQRCSEKGESAFITLSFLNSSVLTSAFDLRIDFYDDNFLVDIAAACAYFSYKHLVPLCQDSVDAICQEAKTRFTRFMDYEMDALARKYRSEVLCNMTLTMYSHCLLLSDMADFWPQLTVSENCCFTFGRFLSNQQQICMFPPMGEAASQ